MWVPPSMNDMPDHILKFSAVLGFYFVHTPGLLGGDNQSVLLDEDNELQPDLFVGIDKARSGQLEVNELGHLSGAPEFVVEVAASSAAYDLHSKLNVYRWPMNAMACRSIWCSWPMNGRCDSFG